MHNAAENCGSPHICIVLVCARLLQMENFQDTQACMMLSRGFALLNPPIKAEEHLTQ